MSDKAFIIRALSDPTLPEQTITAPSLIDAIQAYGDQHHLGEGAIMSATPVTREQGQ
jgi:hypothetical protein